MATQAVAKILKEIDIEIAEVIYCTDSKVVLGYITNESRRFYVYVANRVQFIRNMSSPNQWRYIESDGSRNPADLATRGLHPSKMMESDWLNGPTFLRNTAEVPPSNEVMSPNDSDPEVRKEVTSCKTKKGNSQSSGLGAERSKRLSSLSSLQRALANLIVKIREFKLRKKQPTKQTIPGSSVPERCQTARPPNADELEQATVVILLATQREAFGEELQKYTFVSTANHEQGEREERIARKKSLKQYLRSIDPSFGEDGILRVGGRLRRAEINYGEKHPAILPRNHHVSSLVVRHCHDQVHLQGRQITHGAVRQAGYWLVGGHRLVSKDLHSCVI
ncbi:hypothetical protein QZH41_002987 [Actinostola sp. cb2023]|nr:hypothetical protein QZH41_002987 [Actinostola sp. cb2023]